MRKTFATRLLSSGQPLQMFSIFNAGNDPGCTSADMTRLNVDIENPLQPLSPGHGRMTLNWRLLLLALCTFGLATLAPLRRCHQRTVFAIGCKYTVKSCEIDSGPGHQGGQFGNEIHRLEDHVGGAVSVWRFQLIPDLPLIRQ